MSTNTKNEKLINALVQIGVEISAQKDVDKLFEIILTSCMDITDSDAGSIYFKEQSQRRKKKNNILDSCSRAGSGDRAEDDEKRKNSKEEEVKATKEDQDIEYLRFQYTQNRSKSFPFSSFTLPINDQSIAGACAYNGKTYVLQTMDETVEKIGIHHNSDFDKKMGYRTCNMLVIPMKNYDGEVIGVLQLINKKKNTSDVLIPPYDYDEKIDRYTEQEVSVVESLAAQAAILIERAQLFEGIESLLSSFINTLVTALDQRDTITAGHSRRVTKYAMNLARAVNKAKEGKYKNACFDDLELKELYYAGLLHDVGKIGVREFVLMKENKLTDAQMSVISYRYKWMMSELRIKLNSGSSTDNDKYQLEMIPTWLENIKDINTCGFLTDERKQNLSVICEQIIEINGERIPLITEEEKKFLSVQKGNLTQEEREMIQSHATYSFEILDGIEWTTELLDVPEIAGAHHEFLNGQGYPKGIKGDEIMLQSKILTVADIFDALTASDRPYKPAVPIPRSLNILEEEVKANHLDEELVRLFIDEKLYIIDENQEVEQ